LLLLLGVTLGVLYTAAIVVSLAGPVRGDELYHYAQIHLFRHADLRVLDHYLTTIPGYHAAVAVLLWATGLDSLGAARAVNAAFGLIAASGFFSLRRRLWPGTETLATAQFLLLPILAPLFFLVYTDVLALALILWALVAMLAGRHRWSAFALSGVVLVRQNDVVWAAFVALVAAWPLLRQRDGAVMRELFVRLWPYAVPLLAFLGFWAWNGTISLSHGQAALHPLTVRLGNPFFTLLLAALLLPLQVLAGWRAFIAHARARPWLLAFPLAALALYWWGFHADNPYNGALPDFIPRNAFLIKLDHDPIWRAGAGVMMILAACGLAPTALRPPTAQWLYPFATLFLAASWLIEQRYALVPLVLWLAFREHRSRSIEYATLALWLVLAVWIFSGVAAGRFFL
jgi:alpha-1,2-glucosyltransferase